MSMYPEDEPDKPLSVEQINQMNQEIKEKKITEAGNRSGADNSTITHPDEDIKIQEKKLMQLNGLIQNQLEEQMKPIKAQIEQIPNLINLSIQQAFQGVQNPQAPDQNPSIPLGDNAAPMAAMNPEALGPLMTGLAQILQAWKGNAGGAPQADPFGEMFKQLGINIMQAGVDGIYKQVYDGYQPQPRQASLGMPQPPNQNNQGQSTGFK